jgi:hypothetical protein
MSTFPGKPILISLVVLVASALGAFLFYQSPGDTALAQGGTYGNSEAANNFEAMQQALAAQPDQLQVKVVDASAEDELELQSDGSGVEVVPISALRHDGNNASDWLHLFNGAYIRNNSANQVCFAAPTYPPDGATLTQFRFSVLDDSATDDLVVLLQRTNLANGAVDIIAGGSLAGRDNATAIEAFDSTVSPSAVSSNYAYYITLCFEPNTGTEILFYGARLFYTL